MTNLRFGASSSSSATSSPICVGKVAVVTFSSFINLPTAIASFLILSGRIYTDAPAVSGANKSITDASKQKLANSATTKSGVIFLDATTYSIRFRRFLCSSITPFGFPVEPEV